MKLTHPSFPGLIFVALGGIVVTLSPGCSKESPPSKPSRPPVPVVVVKALVKNVPVEIKAVGNVQAYSAVAVRSQITGPIVGVHFEEGQEVKAGDLLFTIDARPLEAVLSQAQANVKRDEAQLLSSRLEFLRTSNLFQIKIASQQDYDSAEASFRSAEASMLADSAAVSSAQVSLSYTQIRSPIDGRTGDLKAKAGNVIKASDDVLLNITQIHPIYAVFSVPERNLPAIQRRMRDATLPVAAMISGEQEKPRGDLTFVDNAVDTTTGTIMLKATFPNQNNLLWPGQFIQLSLGLSNLLQVTVVPSQAIQSGQAGDYVFIAKPDETVEMRPITTSVTQSGMTVITTGVQPDELVVTDGQLRLTPGAKISVKPAASVTEVSKTPPKTNRID